MIKMIDWLGYYKEPTKINLYYDCDILPQ